ncbi:FAD-dependent oxidoreductase [Xaviernesmea oryzae]|uniref:FAD-dependent oxidoreductase n=1 Tax=Xaviernesmea oryzae TaxID=464029 RepID=UPI00147EED15|nr:FAD-dependent oxidoreductase [Xaviernesmea oryzae]
MASILSAMPLMDTMATRTGAAAQELSTGDLSAPVSVSETEAASQPGCARADVVVYGATPSGIAAAIQAARLKKDVILLEPTRHIGGMMTSGLNKTDTAGKRGIYGGIVKEFLDKAQDKYGIGDARYAYFESRWAERTFGDMLEKNNVRLVKGQLIASIRRSGKTIQSLTATSGQSFCGRSFIDASYEGDLMMRAGVRTIVGREAKSKYREDDAGVQKLAYPHVGDGSDRIDLVIDPYIVPRKPASGLLPGLSSIGQQPVGKADKSLMAYNYRLCVTTDPKNMRPFTKPVDYDPLRYEAVARFIAALAEKGRHLSSQYFIGGGDTVNDKQDVNSNSFFSTNVWNVGYDYATGDEAKREQIRQSVRSYIQGYFWFAVSDPRVPKKAREFTAQYGYCADEFVDNDNFPYQMYVRQARRLVGQFVLTENNLKQRTSFSDGIGLGYYPLDQHGMIRTVLNGHIAEDIRDGISLSPYEIPYRVMLPSQKEVSNLLVSVAISTSHVAYTSIRVEPTYMVLGQAAGAAAALAPGGNVNKVDVQRLRQELAKSGQVLSWW